MTRSNSSSHYVRGGRSFRSLTAALVVAATGAAMLTVLGTGTASAESCRLAAGPLAVEQLPAGTDVIACRAVGRVIQRDGVGLTIPKPGMAVGVEALRATGPSVMFQIEVSSSGKISYPKEVTSSGPSAMADPSACSDDAYSTNDLKVYAAGYKWRVGDGSMPGGLSQSAARTAFADAIDNITGTYDSCGYGDVVDGTATYQGTTTTEADINSSSQCTARDFTSTWDGGDLAAGHVAVACWWAFPLPGVKNELLEADVRFNTSDHRFTNSPTSSCANLYDIRSVGTHEAGHVFGMGHVGSGHSELTMYTNSFTCTTKARTLGKGDVLGLQYIY